MKGHPFEYDRDAAAMDLSEYLRLPFTQFAQEGIGSYANPVAMWNAKVRSYLNVSSHAKILIRHEDLFDLDTLSSKLMKLTEHGFALRPGTTSISYPPLLASGTNLIEKYQFTVADFDGAKAFSQQSWASRFSQRDLHFISAQLDGSTLAGRFWRAEHRAHDCRGAGPARASWPGRRRSPPSRRPPRRRGPAARPISTG